MENIVIQVDSEVAQAYRTATQQQQQAALFLFNVMVKEILKSRSFDELVQEIREDIATSGLTETILQGILEDE
ncbi:hypothetical protein [Picosynechococcus sp. PCC 73109]|uniref:hypothetical protein n=1 Tax=Picosynechococcus sp. PCC 73109 TaxID=374982 RepID=UPI0007458382|nr:hypothetical protein [Picosynechococcus sp. PCC 73109]AMA10192.1 hypothetical protein AWQ23_13160 [Picosynechococcus sp. PCC 73109]